MATDPASGLDGQSVLVTGGAGFVGSHLAAALTDRCEVTVLDDCSTGEAENVPDGAELVRGDVRDPADLEPAMDGVDVVFHQAALADVGASVRSPIEGHRRTASGTVKVLDAARRADARVVAASSAAVYGQPDTLPIRESDRKTPLTPYGIDKLAADQYTRRFADRYGMETVALRYFNVYGPGETGHRSGVDDVVGTFLERARSDSVLPVEGDGTQTRDFVHVDDVVRANLRAATTDATGRAYNVGSGTGVSVREVAERVIRLVDSDSEIVHGDPREGDIKHSRAALGRARSRLGYEPTYDFETGLATLVDRAAVPS
ncbi:NAD-dependent epimerase/dehydratase [Halosimplex carlsbadense 2-9-1]|uniref:NAD-dependent epimerase/dehydratase n=1 Tax=Halosimplex carlsbadense 2-9-1 TaxID=797114 RepID=M0CGC0_9EURY|nr:NAD-dependent epimerase/dehydratase family protein [Halosimplex carlsbadense]ELZ22325.1 NAD-dependent epimerase/dehydratase [Halosimplex carlsbadense 2-9-1]